MPRKTPSFDPSQMLKPPSADIAYLLDTAPEAVADVARERGLPLRDIPVTTVAPDPDQPRQLPAPDQLIAMSDRGDEIAAALLAGLRELGASMREHGQIQPVIVYPDHDPSNPAITHRLLNGQRRWTAAVLAGLPTVWAVEVEKPELVSRLMRQFEENERRAGFTDMERAWALASLQKALADEAGGEVPWTVIEEQVAMSETRRKELMRLLRFEPEGQALIQRYNWGTWMLRPLIQAITADKVKGSDTTIMLQVLADTPAVTQDVVKALVDAFLRGDVARPPTLRPTASHNVRPIIHRRMERMQRSVEQLRTDVMTVRNAEDRAAWRTEAEVLRRSLEALIHELGS